MSQYLKEMKIIIDQRRRDIINKNLANAKGEASEMYHEGRRVVYQEVQDLLERWEALDDKHS